MLGKYFGSIRDIHFPEKTDFSIVEDDENQNLQIKETDIPIGIAKFETDEIHHPQTVKDERLTVDIKTEEETSKERNHIMSATVAAIAELDGEERWRFIRDTFKRVSKTRLQWRRQHGLPPRTEQMGGLNDTFEPEMDTWIQNESDILHDRNTLRKNTLTMYISVV